MTLEETLETAITYAGNGYDKHWNKKFAEALGQIGVDIVAVEVDYIPQEDELWMPKPVPDELYQYAYPSVCKFRPFWK